MQPFSTLPSSKDTKTIPDHLSITACRGDVFRNKKRFSDLELATTLHRWFLSNGI